MGRRKEKRIRDNRHHVIPRSRGGDTRVENIARVNIKKHQHYHALFDNRVPEEIINLLVRKYWNGNWDYVRDAYENRR